MSEREPDLRDRLDERPSLSLDRLREVSGRELGIRFLAGAATSVAAGLVTLAFGATAGGLFLAFPAILAASLTLIAEEEDQLEAREDARGAIVGAVGLAAFGAVAAILFTSVAGGVTLALATATWIAVALVGYAILWGR